MCPCRAQWPDFESSKNGKNELTAGLTQSFLDQRRSEPKKRLAHKSLFSKNKWLSKKFFRRKKFCSKKFFSKVCRRPAPTNFGKKLFWTELFLLENFFDNHLILEKQNFYERNFFWLTSTLVKKKIGWEFRSTNLFRFSLVNKSIWTSRTTCFGTSWSTQYNTSKLLLSPYFSLWT